MIDAIEFVIAVGVVSAMIFVLTIRAENKGAARARSRGGSSDDGVSTSGSDSWSVASWIAYSSSTATSAGDLGSRMTGSWDSGSVGDCGSGGDSGGGGFSGSSD